jgi:hypothetical protein
VVLYQFRISVMVALALLIWETKIKFDDNSSNDMQESQPFITLNVVIASVCLTVMLGMAARLLLCIWKGEPSSMEVAWQKQPRALSLLAACQQCDEQCDEQAEYPKQHSAAAAVRRIWGIPAPQGRQDAAPLHLPILIMHLAAPNNTWLQ